MPLSTLPGKPEGDGRTECGLTATRGAYARDTQSHLGPPIPEVAGSRPAMTA
jgi:hypothetical protein